MQTMLGAVLITGGAGFLGHGLVRQLLADGCERICIYSRDEVKHANMAREFAYDSRLRFLLGDIRDKSRLTEAMEGVEVVIAAAALKRIETAHYNPTELVKTNVVGTMNVVEAAKRAGVRKVVGVSTDKAVASISAYGQSKAMAESILLAANNTRGAHGPRYSICRFGNVWGSTWSLVPTWRALIAAGATTVPVTEPECTRYFMRLQEAVDLVLSIARTAEGGEVAIPTLPAYAVGDLATAMDVAMKVNGLPSHEKKHETMDGLTDSNSARRMSVAELVKELHDLAP